MQISSKLPSTSLRRPGKLQASLEFAGGLAGAAMETVNLAVPSLVAGISAARANQSERPALTQKALYQTMIAQIALGLGAYCVTHGSMAAVATALAAKGVIGAAWTHLYDQSGAAQRVAEGISGAVGSLVREEHSQGRKVVTGSLVGLSAGTWHAARTGFEEGRGFVGGLIDGCKDVPGSALLRLSKLFRGRNLPHPARILVNTLGGVTGAAVQGGLGLVQGFWGGLGTPIEQDDHQHLMLLQGAAVGALVGTACLAGLPGLIVGTAAGTLLGHRVHRLMDSHQAQEEVFQDIQCALQESHSNSTDSEDRVNNTYRKAIGGAVVGLGAALDSGWKQGRKISDRVLDEGWKALGGKSNDADG